MHYVLSDIHGNLRRFEAMLERIGPGSEDMLYVLGDVIDRHPDGIAVLDRIMAMPNARMILGNHEYMMLRALGEPADDYRDDGGALAHWYRNGGDVTHGAWNRLAPARQRELLDYLHSLPLNIDLRVGDRDYRLVHGAPVCRWQTNEDLRYRTPVHFAVWRRLKAEEPLEDGRIVIFGHTPTCNYQEAVPMELWYGPDRIGIDCGCGWPESGPEGRLGCLRLEDGAEFYVK